MIQKRIDKIIEIYGKDPNCYLVGILLSTRFMGTLMYNSEHVITMIGKSYYDKRGKVPIDEVMKGHYLPIDIFGLRIEKKLMDSLIEKHKE